MYRLLMFAIFSLVLMHKVPCQEYILLNEANIVVDKKEIFQLQAAVFLQHEIALRTGLTLPIIDTIPDVGIVSIVLGLADDYHTPDGISVPAKKESFAIWINNNSDSSSKVMLIGRDNRGVLFAAGGLISQLYLSKKFISVSSYLKMASAPAEEFRAQQIKDNVQSEDGYFQWKKESDVQRHINDMILAGANGFEPTIPALADKYLESMGLDLFVKLKCQEIVDLASKSDQEIISYFDGISGLDHLTTYGGDASGAVKPQLFFPFMDRVFPLLLQEQSGAKWWYSNQCMEDHAKDYDAYIFKYIKEKRPPWLYGMAYGPWTKRGIKEVREDLPSQYALFHKPEICHPRSCQYPVPEWDRIFAVVWPRNNSIYAMPTMMTDIYKATSTLSDGSLPYNHTGCYNDLNKFTWTSISWNPEASVEEILTTYARVFFAYDFNTLPTKDKDSFDYHKEEMIDAATKYVTEGLLLLEQNWIGPIKNNTSTEAALEHWETIAKCIGGADKNWRVELFLYKARIDAQIKRKYFMEMQFEDEAMKILENANVFGYKKAVRDAQKTLARIDTEFQSEEEFRKELIEMGLSKKFGDLNIIIENLYTSFNNRLWIEKQIEASKNQDDLHAIVHYENPGEGGFYDNLGLQGEQPHLVRSYEWKNDPGFVYSNIDWVYNKTNSDLRHSQLTHVVARYDTPLEMKWDSLDPTAQYKIRVVYNGPFGNRVRCETDDGYLIHDFIEQPGQNFLDFVIPSSSTADSLLRLLWTQDTIDLKKGVSVSEIWLIKEK